MIPTVDSRLPNQRSALLPMLLMLHWFGFSVHAASEEDIIKAAYLRNALNYANFPKEAFPSPSSPFQIGIAGEASSLKKSMNLAFEELGHRIQARAVKILSFQDPTALSNHASKPGRNSCHAVLLPESEGARIHEWLEALGESSILMISDDPGFIDKGGAVSLVPNPDSKGRYLYNIHTQRLRSRGIRFNSGFLRIRSTVKVVDKEY